MENVVFICQSAIKLILEMSCCVEIDSIWMAMQKAAINLIKMFLVLFVYLGKHNQTD